jgi:hypothetical protein
LCSVATRNRTISIYFPCTPSTLIKKEAIYFI